MNIITVSLRLRFRAALAAFLATAILGPVQSSFAGLTLTSSSGSADFGVYSTVIDEIPPSTFKADGSLQSPGFGLPVLNALVAGLPNQSTSPGSLVPGYTATSTTTSNPSGNGVPTIFGTSATEMTASGTGQGTLLPQGGILWSSKTNLSDKLTSANTNEASVSIFYASATYKNNTSSTVDLAQGTFGTLLNIKGTLGSTTDGSYIAAGLSSTYLLSGNTMATQLDGVVLAGQGTSGYASTGLATGDATSAGFHAGVLSGTATSYASTDVMVAAGQSITLTSTLTLITDPFSSIAIDTDLDPDFNGSLPMFGVTANAAPLVPEPSTVLMLASGLALTGLWARCRRRRPSANS
jgi:PEP-CTERM motif